MAKRTEVDAIPLCDGAFRLVHDGRQFVLQERRPYPEDNHRAWRPYIFAHSIEQLARQIQLSFGPIGNYLINEVHDTLRTQSLLIPPPVSTIHSAQG